MYSVVRKIGFKDDEIFSPKNQDIMGYYLIYSGNKRKYLTDYLLSLLRNAFSFATIFAPKLSYLGNRDWPSSQY